MFYYGSMQLTLDFGARGEVAQMRDQLRAFFGSVSTSPPREPIAQLIKSLISSRTRDDVSLRAFEQLVQTYPRWSDLATADVDKVQALIADVTFADVKALHLVEALRVIAECRPDFDLSFLGNLPVAESLDWLEVLPGVGRKVAASTLNFSTLRQSAFVIDTHVLRVLRRFAFIGPKAETRTAYAVVMAATPGWTAFDYTEFHVMMKRLGQTICQADRTCCRKCPIIRRCKAADKPNHHG